MAVPHAAGDPSPEAAPFTSASSVLAATASVAATVLELVSSGGFRAGDHIFIGTPGDANAEVRVIDSISGDDVTITAGLTNQQNAGNLVQRTDSEVVDARAAFSTLDDRLDSSEAEIVAGRGGQASLDTRADLIEAGITALEGDVEDLDLGIVNVKAFGATGDGVTDDHDAIQAAFDATFATVFDGASGKVYFPAGTYVIGSALTMTDRHLIAIEGSGRRTSIIKNTGTGNAIEILTTGSPTPQNISINHLGIQGNEDSAIGLYIEGGNSIYLENLRIWGHGTWGVQLGSGSGDHCNRVTMIQCFITDNYPANAVLGDGGAVNLEQQTEQTWLYGCSLRSNTSGGTTKINSIGLRIASNINIVGVYGGDIVNHGRGVSIVGTDAGPTTSITLDGIYIEQNDRGIHIGASGSNAEGISNVLVRGNTFTAIQDDDHVNAQGIYVNRSQNVRIDGNDFRNTAGGGVGIAIDGSATKLQIGLNSVMGDFSGTYVSVVGGSPNYSYTTRMIQTKRVTAGAGISAGSSGTIAVTWDAPFLDTNYTVVAVAFHASASHLLNAGVQAKTTTGCTIAVQNNDASARTPTVEVIAFHD